MDSDNLLHFLHHLVTTSYWVSLFFGLLLSHWMEADSHSVLDDTLKNCLNSTHSLIRSVRDNVSLGVSWAWWLTRDRALTRKRGMGREQLGSPDMNKRCGKEATAGF